MDHGMEPFVIESETEEHRTVKESLKRKHDDDFDEFEAGNMYTSFDMMSTCATDATEDEEYYVPPAVKKVLLSNEMSLISEVCEPAMAIGNIFKIPENKSAPRKIVMPKNTTSTITSPSPSVVLSTLAESSSAAPSSAVSSSAASSTAVSSSAVSSSAASATAVSFSAVSSSAVSCSAVSPPVQVVRPVVDHYPQLPTMYAVPMHYPETTRVPQPQTVLDRENERNKWKNFLAWENKYNYYGALYTKREDQN